MNPNYKELYEKYKTLKEENKRLRDEVELLRKILSKKEAETNSSTDFTMVKEASKPGYSPYWFNDFRPGICNKPKVKCSKCKSSDFA